MVATHGSEQPMWRLQRIDVVPEW